MTYEDYTDQAFAIENEKRRLLMALNKKYISELPFKVGDKVHINGFGVGWIRTIQISHYNKLMLSVFSTKKNGEQSKRYHQLTFLNTEDIKLL